MSKKTCVIIVAAGRGKRMKMNANKQLLKIKNKPILAYTLEKFFAHPLVNSIVLVINESEQQEVYADVLNKYFRNKPIQIAYGGKERFNSVYNGLQKVAEDMDNVLIHDGARPLVSEEEITDVILQLQEEKACIVGVPVKNTFKLVDENMKVDRTVPRHFLYSILTPQGFHKELIEEAYAHGIDNAENVTDDSMMVELFTDEKVKVIFGSYDNIKITTPDDITMMEKIIEEK